MTFRPNGDTSSLVRRHWVRAEHASTGKPIVPLRAAFAGETPPGWVLRVRGADAIVSAYQDAPDPPVPPHLELAAADPVVALRLAAPVADIELLPGNADIVHQFEPVLMTLEIELVLPDGDPSAGRAVAAHGSAGDVEALPEVAGTPGTYRSAARVWTSEFDPFEVRADGNLVTSASIDFTSPITRVRLVDTT